MRVVDCIFTEHDLWLVLLAAVVCAFGSTATVRLWLKGANATGRVRFEWFYLASVIGGASIWATHFIAMLGYRVDAPVAFDPQLTIVSVAIAIVGLAIGLALTSTPNVVMSRILGGATIGLAISAMHFVGMFAYRVEGIVSWDMNYIALSIASSIAFSILATTLIVRRPNSSAKRQQLFAAAALVTGIITLHFFGMTAFSVSPIANLPSDGGSEAFNAMAMTVAFVAFLIVFTGFASQVIDDRNRMKSEKDLLHTATHDELTGLPNRRHFTEILEGHCEKLRDGGSPFGFLVINLDGFKPINDMLGSAVGDEVLRTVARRLSQVVKSTDFLARRGSDDFAILTTHHGEGDCVVSLCDEVSRAISLPMSIDGHTVELGSSIGYTLAAKDGSTSTDLVQNADLALLAAKSDELVSIRGYEPRMSVVMNQRSRLEGELRGAIQRSEFVVHYQMQVDAKTGALTGAEALVRWNHPERGLLAPGLFIPLAEEIGLINTIGLWVLQRACRDATSWPEHLQVSVNLSPVQIMDSLLPETVRGILEETGLAPGRLELEITETAIIGNDDRALLVLNALRKLGVALSLDDFGTGYSSLSFLRRFPINRIKIDRSFVDRAPGDGGSLSIIHAITALGTSLGMKVTAEGIETDEQRQVCRIAGCDDLQGYMIGRPTPLEDLRLRFAIGERVFAAA